MPEDVALRSADPVLWHATELPLKSVPFKRVPFGLDEEASVLWAVEHTVAGREVGSRKVHLPDGP